MATSFENDDHPTLSKKFDHQLKIFVDIDKSDIPTKNEELQNKISSTIKKLEELTIEISYLGVFASNEAIEELTANSLKFLMLPVLLGCLTLKLQSTEREEILRVASIYFKDFLKRCSQYQLTSYADHEEEGKSSEKSISEKPLKSQEISEDLKRMAKQREEKIERYKEKKTLDAKIAELKTRIENPSHDDEIVREYFIAMIKNFIYQSLDELDSISMELKVLQGMKLMKREGASLKESEKPKPLRPFLITRDAAQKKVFGLGYPSLPVMSVEELYEQRVKDGWYPSPSDNHNHCKDNCSSHAHKDTSELKDEEEEEEEEEEDIEKLRQRDEWRDDHKRGWGNRYNRS